MTRTVVTTNQAPAAIGPYSQAIASGSWIFCSGQVALHPETGELEAPGDVVRQTERVISNLTAVLRAAGASLDDVVKTTIYLMDLKDFVAVNEVYGRAFSGSPPARSTVQVAGLPRGARVEIDAIALVPPSR